jgi:hypothetical protein
MDDNFIELRVVYEDLPDLLELGVVVRCGQWSAFSRAYIGPSFLTDDSRRLLEWVSAPHEPVEVEAGGELIGSISLKFYTINRAGHARCAVSLATGPLARDARPEETWRFKVEMPTELGLVERFAKECVALSTDFSREARLLGLPT